MKVNRFEDLEIWKLAAEIAVDIYKITSEKKFIRDYGLRDQLRRAAISISSNIAEGFEINNNNDLIRFLKVAKGSAGELRSQLLICSRLDYITEKQTEEIKDKLLLLSAKIGKFISYLLVKRRNKEFLTR